MALQSGYHCGTGAQTHLPWGKIKAEVRGCKPDYQKPGDLPGLSVESEVLGLVDTHIVSVPDTAGMNRSGECHHLHSPHTLIVWTGAGPA